MIILLKIEDCHMCIDTLNIVLKMSTNQIIEASVRAKSEGMRQIAEALRAQESSESELELDSDSTPSRKRRRKMSTDKAIVHKLETRIHYLTLDLANSKVEHDDSCQIIDNLKNTLTPYKRVNDELAYLKSAMNRVFKDTNNLKKVQLEHKFKLFNDETREHIGMCHGQIMRIEHEEIKFALIRILEADKRKVNKLAYSYKMLILRTHIKELAMNIGFWLSVLMALYAMLVSFIL